jgi:hypothetical protein
VCQKKIEPTPDPPNPPSPTNEASNTLEYISLALNVILLGAAAITLIFVCKLRKRNQKKSNFTDGLLAHDSQQ